MSGTPGLSRWSESWRPLRTSRRTGRRWSGRRETAALAPWWPHQMTVGGLAVGSCGRDFCHGRARKL
jgi:hypothetical protein